MEPCWWFEALWHSLGRLYNEKCDREISTVHYIFVYVSNHHWNGSHYLRKRFVTQMIPSRCRNEMLIFINDATKQHVFLLLKCTCTLIIYDVLTILGQKRDMLVMPYHRWKWPGWNLSLVNDTITPYDFPLVLFLMLISNDRLCRLCCPFRMLCVRNVVSIGNVKRSSLRGKLVIDFR